MENYELDWNYKAWTMIVDEQKAKVAKLEEENARLKEENRKLIVKGYLDSLN